MKIFKTLIGQEIFFFLTLKKEEGQPGLSCSFPLTLVTGHGNSKLCPVQAPIFQICFPLPLLWNSSTIYS